MPTVPMTQQDVLCAALDLVGEVADLGHEDWRLDDDGEITSYIGGGNPLESLYVAMQENLVTAGKRRFDPMEGIEIPSEEEIIAILPEPDHVLWMLWRAGRHPMGLQDAIVRDALIEQLQLGA